MSMGLGLGFRALRLRLFMVFLPVSSHLLPAALSAPSTQTVVQNLAGTKPKPLTQNLYGTWGGLRRSGTKHPSICRQLEPLTLQIISKNNR